MSVKDWERAWSFDEIAENASNWSLAGDAGLLRNLEAFADNLFERTNKTNDNLNKLLANLDSASIRLDLIKNEFLSLQNTQFVESRVYEDDETFHAPTPIKAEPKPNNEEKLKNLRNAVVEGIEILDKYYDKVPVDASDSEDEVDFVSYVLRPKDPYLDRPLPYVIGTEEWHKKWHVGLQDSSSESEREEETDKFSDTDSEENLPVPDRRRDLVSTSDDSDLSKPVASSTFNDTDSEDNSIPAKDLLPKESFAEQLAARLGNVVVQSSKEEPAEINNRPIKPAAPITNQRLFGDLFSNEPPPLESDDEHAAQGVFSGGQGLFDESDDENESFWGQKIPPKIQPQSSSGRKNGPSNSMSSTFLKQESKISSGLFDDSDEDGIFGEVKAEKSPYLKSFHSGPVFIDDEPPELIVKPKSDNKQNLIEEIKKKVEKGNGTEEVVKKVEVEVTKTVEAESKKKTVGGLFDDPVDLFKDDLFGDVSTSDLFGGDTLNKKKKFDGLFDEEGDRETPPPLIIPEQEKLHTSTRNLFEDEDADDLFGEKKPRESKIPSLFDDQPPPDPDWDTSSQKNLFDDEDDDNYDFLQTPVAPANSNHQRFSLFDDEPPALDFHRGKTANLFDEEDPEEDALPSNVVNTITGEDEDLKTVPEKTDLNIQDKLVNAVTDEEGMNTKTVNMNVAGSSQTPDRNDDGGTNILVKSVNMFDEEEEEDAWVDEVEHDIYSCNKGSNLWSDVKKDAQDVEKGRDAFDDFVGSVDMKGHDNMVENKASKNDTVNDLPKEVTARKKISLFEDPDVSEDDLFSDKQATDLFTSEHKEITQLNKQSKLFQDYEEDLEKTPETVKSPPPGKLKHNLNINVAALMPGAALPKRKEPEDQVVAEENKLESSYKSEDGALHGDDQTIETLYSITKTRARIPIKRKPSSRRARQESMKKTASLEDDKNNNIENDDVVNENVAVFKKNETLEQISKSSKNLFDDEEDDDSDLLFNKTMSKAKISKSLFDDEDDEEDDLFKPTKKEKSKRTETNPPIRQGSLFDDLSDDDGDIFNSKSKPLFNKGVTKQSIKIPKPKNSLKKSEECEVLDDPLDALNK